MTNSEKAVQAVREIATIIEETAREAAPLGAPSGVVYAALMGVGVSLDTFQAILSAMESAGRVTVRGDLIKAVA